MVESQEKQTYKYLKYTGEKYEFITEEIPTPGAGEVLVKVEFSTINPIDRYTYFSKVPRLGSDGSGTIVQVGEGVSQDLVNKKVAFLGAAWSQYRVLS